MNVQMEPIFVITAAPTQMDHTHVAVTQVINSMKMGCNVMVSFGYEIHTECHYCCFNIIIIIIKPLALS